MKDPILYWNAVAMEANRVAHTVVDAREAAARGPIGSSRAMAIVHLAMHDAYFSIVPAPHGTYLWQAPTPPAEADVDAAVAAAAMITLTTLYPAQKSMLDRAHAEAGLSGPGIAQGHRHGTKVAKAILGSRSQDPSTGDEGHVASLAPTAHRVDPINPGQGYHAPNYGARASCFAVTSRHRLDPPPGPGDLLYEEAFDEVKAKGAAGVTSAAGSTHTARTPEETLIGFFWAYDGAQQIGTPPRLFNQIVRAVAASRENTVSENARLFALVNVAMGDAGILAWDCKYENDLWRPVVGIREHDQSMGPTAVAGSSLDSDCDPFWTPLGAPRTNELGAKSFSPPFPAYPSGHATFGAAALQMTRLFYGESSNGPDSLADGLAFVSDELNGVSVDSSGVIRPRHVRGFPGGLWQMIEENGRARVYLGVHWAFDAFATAANGDMDLSRNIGGVPLGLTIAKDLWTNGLKAANAAGARLV